MYFNVLIKGDLKIGNGFMEYQNKKLQKDVYR